MPPAEGARAGSECATGRAVGAIIASGIEKGEESADRSLRRCFFLVPPPFFSPSSPRPRVQGGGQESKRETVKRERKNSLFFQTGRKRRKKTSGSIAGPWFSRGAPCLSVQSPVLPPLRRTSGGVVSCLPRNRDDWLPNADDDNDRRLDRKKKKSIDREKNSRSMLQRLTSLAALRLRPTASALVERVRRRA